MALIKRTNNMKVAILFLFTLVIVNARDVSKKGPQTQYKKDCTISEDCDKICYEGCWSVEARLCFQGLCYCRPTIIDSTALPPVKLLKH